MAVALAALIIEAGAWLTTRTLVARGWMADVPAFQPADIDRYFLESDPLIGWTADVVPAADACVSAYGDSFTGGETGISYPEALSRLLGCPVTNLGVGGFGSDQALMLARRMRSTDRAPVTILGHVSENILRNVNQYRNLLYPGQELMFKPRFIEDSAALRTLPVPVARRADFERLTDAPESVLTYDAFISRPRREFPHTVTIARWLLDDFHVRATIAGVPRHEPFYREDHPARGLQVTSAILSAFSIETINDGRTPLILLLPLADDFLFAKREGRWPDQPLADRLRAGGVRVVHAGPEMAARLDGGDHCQLFEDCRGHYNARGYTIVAALVANAIRDAVPPRSPARDTP
jgi:hypothetical protein